MPVPSRIALALVGAAVAAATVGTAAGAAVPTSGNLIRNSGAESTGSAPTPDGAKVAVTDWTVSSTSNFTAVAYGAPLFPTATSAGPGHRGANFFAGGTDGAVNSATQVDSLARYRRWIGTGKATFKLYGWLGGYSSQNDHALLSVTWLTSTGRRISSTTLKTVTAAQRKDVTGMQYRSARGTVPKTAASARVTVTMVRTDGMYDDGYADNLSLVITR